MIFFRKKNIKNILRLVIAKSFLCFFISCQVQFDLRNEIYAAEQIVQDLNSKKIIFIGNNHTNAYPSLFLRDNLNKFYEAGLRYIFLEGDINHYLDELEDYEFRLFPAWGSFGYRFEDTLLGDVISEINKEHKEDPIKVVLPEKGLVLTAEEWEDDTLTNNLRDKYIQSKIIEIMDNTDSKAIIFYGDAHGLKKSEIWDISSKEPYWVRMGYYLDMHYGNDFSTYYFYPYHTDKNKSVLYNNELYDIDECKSLSETNIDLLLKTEKAKRDYDHYCLYNSDVIHSVPSYYVPTGENLRFMLSLLTAGKIPLDKDFDIWSKKSEQLFALYFLKYHLGDMFEYDYTCSDEQLLKNLNKLKKTELGDLTYNLEELELYSFYMTEWIGSYVCNHDTAKEFIERDLDFYLKKMSQAQRLNPRDIWPQYWIAYFLTEKALFSDNITDYRKAMTEWEKLFENELFYVSPVMKVAYEKMLLCAKKTGDEDNALTYEKKAESVNTVLNIDFKKYQYFGW